MSGSIIVFTDSDCMSSQRQIRPCNQLFEHLVDIVTRPRQYNETKPSFMMEDPFKLPFDYHKRNEVVIYKTLDDFVKEPTTENTLIKNAKLNSLSMFDKETSKSTCLGPSRFDYYSALQPYEHTESEKRIETWTVQPAMKPKSSGWIISAFIPILGLILG